MFGSLFDDMKKKAASKEDGEKTGPNSFSKQASKRERKRSKTRTLETKKEDAPPASWKRLRLDEKRQWKPPSKEALALSARLKELSSQKRLPEALLLYRDKANDQVRDSHHACSVIDCASRCGDVSEGEQILNEMKASRMNITTETYTALLKGYAHAGALHKGAALYEEMSRQAKTNVRSLNTLLRGCLWTASTVDDGKIAGGIATSEVAWKKAGKYLVDISSFEYYIAQLCQALRLEDAEKEINRMKQINKIDTKRGKKSDTFEAEDCSALESLAMCLLALARANAMLGRESRHSAKSAINAVEAAKRRTGKLAVGQPEAYGGKRAWKKNDDDQREKSNTLYRGHRLSEILNDANAIIDVRKKGHPKLSEAAQRICLLLMTRLFYFSGGGTTGKVDFARIQTKNVDTLFNELMTTRWISFGLKSAFSVHHGDSDDFEKATVLTGKQCGVVTRTLGLDYLNTFDQEGFLNFDSLFLFGDFDVKNDRPVDIELGSGFGDWAYFQAKNKPERNFVAVELRADRVAQTFSRIVLNGTSRNNLCCVGAECGSFLSLRVRKETVSTIFVNHPEPPTQTYGSDDVALKRITNGGDEPGHMLSSNIIIAAAECLKPGDGRLVIVTDNRMYARLIGVSILKGMKRQPTLMDSVKLDGFTLVESFGSVSLYEGQPGEEIRHAQQSGGTGHSYFDRLWKTGAGSHAERSKRFVIVIKRCEENSKIYK